jgi:hypothetical protein
LQYNTTVTSKFEERSADKVVLYHITQGRLPNVTRFHNSAAEATTTGNVNSPDSRSHNFKLRPDTPGRQNIPAR